MGTPENKPLGHELMQNLTALGGAQLGTQVIASTGLEAQALGIMGFDVAVAAIVVAVRGGAYMWVVSLWLLAISAAFAVQTLLFTPRPEVGPKIHEVLKERKDLGDEAASVKVLETVAKATEENVVALANKARPVGGAMTCLALAIVAVGLGRL
jgi:hypothetical protein